ncbi:MAG: hypothetical protein ACYDB2_08185 [Acidimicrobiales bacterium]
MNESPPDLSEGAERRLGGRAFSSGLSVSDFGACLEMGLEPVGLVQGFCAMHQGTYVMGGALSRNLSPYGGSGGGYVQNYQCPHGMISNEHRMWGQNYEQTWVQDAWNQGFTSAYERMLDEATALGAHGVVGVFETQMPLGDVDVIEFHLRGTAVKVLDMPSPTSSPWTTYLAGQRLAKVFEAGYVPVSIIAAVSSVRVWAYCVTEYLMEGFAGSMWTSATNSSSPMEIEQIVTAQTWSRQKVRSLARSQLRGDALHGADVQLAQREFQKGDLELQALLRGNRIRRFKDFDPLPAPQPTVRLS